MLEAETWILPVFLPRREPSFKSGQLILPDASFISVPDSLSNIN